jgi:glycine/D-amino acid oxidase-like deaminating enzyme
LGCNDIRVKLEPYWLDSAPRFQRAADAPLASLGRVDAAIVGGGFTGLSAALALARRGANVVVLEAGRVAGEASGRNGGHCSNGVAHDYEGLVRRYGEAKARAMYRDFDAAVDSVEDIVREESIDCDFLRSGKLKLAAKPEHFAGLVRTFERLGREVDTGMELVDAARLPTEIDSTQFHGGLLQKKSAQMHVGRFGAGLAEAAARHGARVYESATVTKLERLSGRAHRITTARGMLEASQVLLATGASRPGPLSWFRRRIVPVGSFIVATTPLDAALAQRLMPGRRNYVTTRIIGNYFRLTRDNRLIYGGRARFAMPGPLSDEKSGRVLRESLESVFPALAGVKIDYCWGGLVDMTADRLPRAGEHDGLLYSMGYSGHGVQMSTHMGRVMADVIDGRKPASPWLDLDWRAIPGNFGDPWFLPFVGAYYRVQDMLH